jgi:putative endonuclease
MMPGFFYCFMGYWIYILKNIIRGRYYCGHTDDLERHLREHNDPLRSGVKWTRKTDGEWTLVWSMEVESRGEAMVEERKIKNRGAGRYLSGALPTESRRGRD